MVSNKMNSKHRKTLKALFENLVRSNIVWGDIEKLFVSLDLKRLFWRAHGFAGLCSLK